MTGCIFCSPSGLRQGQVFTPPPPSSGTPVQMRVECLDRQEISCIKIYFPIQENPEKLPRESEGAMRGLVPNKKSGVTEQPTFTNQSDIFGIMIAKYLLNLSGCLEISQKRRPVSSSHSFSVQAVRTVRCTIDLAWPGISPTIPCPFP